MCLQVRTQTLVKSAIVQIDAAPFRQYYQQHYGTEVRAAAVHNADGCLADFSMRRSTGVFLVGAVPAQQSKVTRWSHIGLTMQCATCRLASRRRRQLEQRLQPRRQRSMQRKQTKRSPTICSASSRPAPSSTSWTRSGPFAPCTYCLGLLGPHVYTSHRHGTSHCSSEE